MTVSERTYSGIRVIIGDADTIAQIAGRRIIEAVKAAPDVALAFPTGSSPEGVYANIISSYRRRAASGPDPSWSQVRCFNLDEYWRLPPWHPQSYACYMRTHLYDWVDVMPNNIFYPDSLAPTAEEACESFESQIAACGGIEHVLLGIGANGHIGFNEAGLPRSRTHIADLATSTILANSRFFETVDAVPKQAITAGLDTILEARAVTLIALGSTKASAVRQMLTGPPDVACPASLLQEVADRCLVCLDPDAAGLLPEQ